MSLTINIITRGRPHLLTDTVQRVASALSRDDTRLLISVDDDDGPTIDVLDQFINDPRIIPLIRPREDEIGEKWNRALMMPADVYLPLSDYCWLSTPGFDQKILDAYALFPDGIGCVYGHLCNASFPSIQAISHKLAEKMGFLYPPYFPYWFVDHWVDDLVRMIDRIAFVDIDIDCSSRKPGTAELRDLRFWTTVFDAHQLDRRSMARSIIDSPDFIDTPEHKEILRGHYPLIEYRSKWISDCLRDQAEHIERSRNAGPGGPRYDRVKAKAANILRQKMPELAALANLVLTPEETV